MRDSMRELPQGEDARTPMGWPGPVVEQFDLDLNDVLNADDVPNAEGFVIRFKGGLMVKSKFSDYVRLHRLVTGLSEKSVWEHMSTHDGYTDELLADIPEEFHGWVFEVEERLWDAYEDISGVAHDAYNSIFDEAYGAGDPDIERRTFAIQAHKCAHPGLLFMLYDGKDLAPAIWKMIKPRGETQTAVAVSEDAA